MARLFSVPAQTGCISRLRSRLSGPLLCACLLLMTWTPIAQAKPVEVIVGGYPYRPYVSANYDGTGVTAGLIAVLNLMQPDYRFVFKPISANRRYQKMSERSIDLIMFEDPRWEWLEQPVLFSRPFMIDGEPYRDLDLYVALREQASAQSFFNSLQDKSLLLTRGYHYAFAQFVADEDQLKSRFNAYFVDDPETVITMLLSRRGQIGLVTRSLLIRHLALHPEDRDKFLVSRRADNVNNLAIVVGQHAPISKKELDQLLIGLERSGRLKTLFQQHYLIE